MTDREAMQMALGALNELTEEFRGYDLPYGSKAYNKATDAINSLHQALAQPEKEPELVAVIGNWGRVEWADGVYPQMGDRLYSAPQKQWVGLTLDEIRDIWIINSQNTYATDNFAYAIEAALRSKNDCVG